MKQVVRIDHFDPAYSRVIDREHYNLVYDILKYSSVQWVQGRYRKEKVARVQSFLHRGTGEFPTGFIPRIQKELSRQDVAVEIVNLDPPIVIHEPSLPGIILRDDQKQLLDNVAKMQRGYIKAPTGSGKTVIAGAIISMLPPNTRTLFLCHTIDLLNQTRDEFTKFGFDVQVVNPDNKVVNLATTRDVPSVVVSTVQTFSKLPKEDLIDISDAFTAIIVDECHHITSRKGTYATILNFILAPIRIGVTATDEIKTASKMVLEGCLGPKIGEFTLKEGIEKGVLAEPLVKWVIVPVDNDLLDIIKYQELYKEGVVNNRARNRLVITHAMNEIAQGHSVLILVKHVEQGKNLIQMAEKIIGEDIDHWRFVWSNTGKDERGLIKNALENKDIKCVIASAVWKEGINIKSLDVVINAAGGKSEIATLQGIGRGLRTTATKNTVTIIDFLDGYNRYLSHHAMLRMKVYIENKWTMKGV
jgi:superfamily II DNA or RNA helicase